MWFGQIQQHSSLENDYLTNGFWAMNREEELPNPGLTVTMMKKMEEVTEQVLQGVDDGMSMQERGEKINETAKHSSKLPKKKVATRSRSKISLSTINTI